MDPMGAGLEAALVRISRLPLLAVDPPPVPSDRSGIASNARPQRVWDTRTDDRGLFNVLGLADGKYRYDVSKELFVSASGEVTVRGGLVEKLVSLKRSLTPQAALRGTVYTIAPEAWVALESAPGAAGRSSDPISARTIEKQLESSPRVPDRWRKLIPVEGARVVLRGDERPMAPGTRTSDGGAASTGERPIDLLGELSRTPTVDQAAARTRRPGLVAITAADGTFEFARVQLSVATITIARPGFQTFEGKLRFDDEQADRRFVILPAKPGDVAACSEAREGGAPAVAIRGDVTVH
ncbi:MAG: hypothetical protein HY815_04995 [Candidatus Riflebacteria bacterium]|nr:hypothetical protein [Candidatus Riflebacteria bacterium]